MPDPIPRGPFDQGLFLTHFNKGRELFDAKQYDLAERQLEEAYLLRPRDVRVLNLLGLVYFRQDKLERAEEVYRKLVTESPDAHTLHYNLGLICLKLNRLQEAESSFLKALELTRGHPKIHFYLGSLYERLHRYKDAIYQYREAGANLLVQRVEGKLAGNPPPSTPPPPARKGRVDTRPPGLPPPIVAPETAGVPSPKVVVPVSPDLMAPAGAEPGQTRASPSSTARRPAFDDTLPLHRRPWSEEEALQVPPLPRATTPPRGSPRPPARPTAQPPPGDGPGRSDVPPPPAAPAPALVPSPPVPSPDGAPWPEGEVFRCLEKGLLEVDFSGKIFLKLGTIYSYAGNLTFWVKEKRPAGKPSLVIVTGTGRLLLTDGERDITFMQVADETICVEPSHLLACEEGLQPRHTHFGESEDAVDVVVLEGRGRVALSVASKPLPLTVRPGLPVSVPASSVIMWTGDLLPSVVDDPTVYEVVLAPHAGRGRLLRLDGSGRVLVEQSAVP
jgi:Tfp pilus assembly protein PilF